MTEEGKDLDIKVVRTLPEAAWRRFVNQQPQSNIFHTPEMFQVFQHTKGYKPEAWATMNQDGQILALLLPIQIALGNGIARFFTTRAVVYGGVLYDHSSQGKRALDFLLRTYVQEVDREVIFTELRNQSDLTDIQAVLNQCGFIYEDHLNYLISLNRPIDDIFRSFGQQARNRIRRELRRGEIVIQAEIRKEHIYDWYDLLRQTYTAARVPLADRSLFEAVFNILCPLGMAKFHIARVGQTCASASLELIHNATLYSWYGGVNRAYSSYHPNEMLTWHVLQWGAEHGYQVYDFGGAGKPDEPYGVRDFKSKFGGTLVNYGRNLCYHAPQRLAVSKVGYQIYRRLWNRPS